MVIIGVAAAPASGKSTVARLLADLGATWINADTIAHEVLTRPEIIATLVSHFGGEICSPDGTIDRRALASRVFVAGQQRSAELGFLESIVHPPTHAEIMRQMVDAGSRDSIGVVLDVPLLFESGWANQCDEIWFIDTSVTIQAAEAARRNWSANELGDRQRRQMDVAEKRRLSTRVISNHGSIAELEQHAKKNWLDCVRPSAVDADQFEKGNHCQPWRGNGY